MLTEVMTAPSGFRPEAAIFPYLATQKIDGIRFYIEHGDVWARSNKPIRNLWIRQELPKFLPNGVDGELFFQSYSRTMSEVMTEGSIPHVGIYPFDYVPASAGSVAYVDRVKMLQAVIKATGWQRDASCPIRTYKPTTRYVGTYRIHPLYPTWVQNHAQFDAFYAQCLSEGHEGMCLRSPQSPYKQGRCTIAENWLLKYKPVEDREARILGVEELMVNTNESHTNELGRSSRSTAAAGMVPGGTFGAFHVRDIVNEIDFKVGGGPGLTAVERMHLWERRAFLPGMIIKYRSMPYGAVEKPRQPQFIGFRDERDL